MKLIRSRGKRNALQLLHCCSPSFRQEPAVSCLPSWQNRSPQDLLLILPALGYLSRSLPDHLYISCSLQLGMSCRRCEVYTSETYHDRFSGEDSIHTSCPIPKKRGINWLLWLNNAPIRRINGVIVKPIDILCKKEECMKLKFLIFWNGYLSRKQFAISLSNHQLRICEFWNQP